MSTDIAPGSIKLFTEQYLKGTVSFTTSREAGTVFRVGLPADCVVDPAAVTAAPEGADAPSRPLRILLADDNRINRRLTAALLERRDHRVTICANGREAVEHTAKQAFDLVLMDVQMPEMDGIAATRAIRTRKTASGSGECTPILAMTGLTGGAARQRCLEAGMDGSVSKPIRPDELDRFAAGRKSPSPPAAGPIEGPAAFDPEEVLAGMGYDRGLLAEMAALFRETAPESLAAIRCAAAAGDAEALERTAHALKGSAANFSAHAVVSAAQGVEDSARDRGLVRAAQAMADLEAAMDRLTAALGALVTGDTQLPR